MKFKDWKKDLEVRVTAFAKRWNEIHPNNKISFVDEALKQVEKASANKAVVVKPGPVKETTLPTVVDVERSPASTKERPLVRITWAMKILGTILVRFCEDIEATMLPGSALHQLVCDCMQTLSPARPFELYDLIGKVSPTFGERIARTLDLAADDFDEENPFRIRPNLVVRGKQD